MLFYFNLVEEGDLFKKLHGKLTASEARLLAIQTLTLGLHRTVLECLDA